MPLKLKPVAPSVKDVRKQIRAAIKQVKFEQAKHIAAQGARAAKLTAKINVLHTDLANAAGNIDAQNKRLKRLEEFVGEHHRRSSSLNRQAEGDKIELKLLRKQLADMNDLAD